MPSKSKVCFFFESRNFTLKNRKDLKSSIESLFKREGKKLLFINYIFCSDKRLLEINRQFLQHDYYTDIITFDLSTSISIEAEVYISVDRVKSNASDLGASFKTELHRVIFHGALHLSGYGDKNKSDQLKMRDREDYYLSSYYKA